MVDMFSINNGSTRYAIPGSHPPHSECHVVDHAGKVNHDLEGDIVNF